MFSFLLVLRGLDQNGVFGITALPTVAAVQLHALVYVCVCVRVNCICMFMYVCMFVELSYNTCVCVCLHAYLSESRSEFVL